MKTVYLGLGSNIGDREEHLRAAVERLAASAPHGEFIIGSAGSAPQYLSPLTGKPAPAFALEDLSGKKISLAGYKGKAVLINFWATWCAPCKIETPWLIELRNRYAAQGFEARKPRHPHIGNHHVMVAGTQRLHRVFAGVRRDGFKALGAQEGIEQAALARIVIHDQDARRFDMIVFARLGHAGKLTDAGEAQKQFDWATCCPEVARPACP